MNLLVGGKCAPKTPKRREKQLTIPSPALGRMDAGKRRHGFERLSSGPGRRHLNETTGSATEPPLSKPPSITPLIT
jgi:hypothetical protein